MLINFSNHPSDKWPDKQIKAAGEYGEGIKDIRFPKVPTSLNEDEIEKMADDYVARIIDNIEDTTVDVVMVQGEFTLSFAVVRRLMYKNIRVVSACSDRVAKEYTDDRGRSRKEVIFDFVRFRQYR